MNNRVSSEVALEVARVLEGVIEKIRSAERGWFTYGLRAVDW
jgi:hypothetical protein